MNEKIRQQGLSAKEILFSRDQFSQANLQLNDDKISEDIMKKRYANNESSAKSKAQVNRKATKAKVEKGNVVFLKQEGDKHHRRDLYMVLEILPAENSLIIVKLLHALSGNHSITFQPHNITYKVKDTDVILSPDQPTFYYYENEDLFDDYHDEEEDIPNIQPKKPAYPYEDFSDDDFEIEENIEELEEESEYDSFSTDDYDEDADEENSDSQDSLAASDQENILQENIQTRELEISNLIENQDDLGAAGGHDLQENFNQSKPKQGDIVSFVHEDYWIKAKIKNKPRKNPNSHFYNIELEDGTLTGVELLPQAGDTVYSWTILPQSEWRPNSALQSPTDQLRADQFPAMGSKEPSPVHQSEQREDFLYPDQQIQSGRVYSLPLALPYQAQSTQTQYHPTPGWSQVKHQEYMEIYKKVLKNHHLNPNIQEQENFAHLLVRDQLYLDNNSTFQKMKRAILKKK